MLKELLMINHLITYLLTLKSKYLPAVNVARHTSKVPKITKEFMFRLETVDVLFYTELVY